MAREQGTWLDDRANHPPSGQSFRPGDKVRLRADPRRRGVITDGPRMHGQGTEYEVALGDTDEWFASELLELVPRNDRPRWVRQDDLLRALTLAKLRHPLTDALYSYRASRTEFQAYQFRPAIKFLHNHNQRLLIADEVGLGKTIEAAIIYLELKARTDIRRVMVLCPSRLTGKWRDELRNRFDEDFRILDRSGVTRLLEDIQRLGSALSFKAIAPFETLRSPGFVERLLDAQIPLDLLIVDEAHYLRNEETKTYKVGDILISTADAVVFLTATPLHLRNRDLFNLINLLVPEEFPDPILFAEQLKPNAAIYQATHHVQRGHLHAAAAALREVETTELAGRYRKDPTYRETLQRLQQLSVNPQACTVKERVDLQWKLAELHTLSRVLTRTRKREIQNAAIRAPYSIRVSLSPEERELYDAVLTAARETAILRGTSALGLSAITRERQAASCLAAFRRQLEDQRSTLWRDLELSPFDPFADELSASSDEDQVPPPSRLLALSRAIGSKDSKFEKFSETLQRALEETPDSKVLVFSFFKGTLHYLRERLHCLGLPAEMIHGDVSIPDRRQIIDRFRDDNTLRVLLSSEVGAEGLDFQFCDILVNYDLPWNPMQVEQRIGRLDRYGQKHPRIRIYNFFLDDTIETRIIERLYERLGVFRRSIGDLEDILGDEIRELSKHVIQRHLTPADEEKLAEDVLLRLENRLRMEAELDEHRDEFLGLSELFDQRVQQTIRRGNIITGNEVRALVVSFLREKFPNVRVRFDHEEPCATIEIDAALASHLWQVIDPGRPGLSERFQQALANQSRIAITFDDQLARERPALEFITIRHPLAQAAIQYWQEHLPEGFPCSTVAISGPPEEAGDGHFFIFLVTVRSVTPSVTLEPIIILDDGRIAKESGDSLLRSLQESAAVPHDLNPNEVSFQAALDRAAGEIAQHRNQVEASVRERNAVLLEARKASVRGSFEAKIDRAERQLAVTDDERIRRMKQSQIRHLRAQLEAKLEALAHGQDVAVSSTLLAGGRIRIVPSAKRAGDSEPSRGPAAVRGNGRHPR